MDVGGEGYSRWLGHLHVHRANVSYSRYAKLQQPSNDLEYNAFRDEIGILKESVDGSPVLSGFPCPYLVLFP